MGGVLTTRARGAASIPSPTACPRCRRGRATTKFKFGCGRVVHLCRQCAQRFVLILSEKINILEHTHGLQHDPSMRHTEQDPLPQGWACGAPPRSDPPRTMAPDASEHTSSDCSMSGQSHHLRSPSPAQIAAPSPQPVSGTTAPGPSTHLSWPHTPLVEQPVRDRDKKTRDSVSPLLPRQNSDHFARAASRSPDRRAASSFREPEKAPDFSHSVEPSGPQRTVGADLGDTTFHHGLSRGSALPLLDSESHEALYLLCGSPIRSAAVAHVTCDQHSVDAGMESAGATSSTTNVSPIFKCPDGGGDAQKRSEGHRGANAPTANAHTAAALTPTADTQGRYSSSMSDMDRDRERHPQLFQKAATSRPPGKGKSASGHRLHPRREAQVDNSSGDVQWDKDAAGLWV